ALAASLNLYSVGRRTRAIAFAPPLPLPLLPACTSAPWGAALDRPARPPPPPPRHLAPLLRGAPPAAGRPRPPPPRALTPTRLRPRPPPARRPRRELERLRAGAPRCPDRPAPRPAVTARLNPHPVGRRARPTDRPTRPPLPSPPPASPGVRYCNGRWKPPRAY